MLFLKLYAGHFNGRHRRIMRRIDDWKTLLSLERIKKIGNITQITIAIKCCLEDGKID